MTAHPARFWLGLLAAFVFALWLLRAVLLPFVLGMAVGAILLDPVVDRLARRGIPRAAAAGVIVFASYGMGTSSSSCWLRWWCGRSPIWSVSLPVYAREAQRRFWLLANAWKRGPVPRAWSISPPPQRSGPRSSSARSRAASSAAASRS